MLTRELRLKNFVKILPSGQIAPDDLLMMRILICDAQNPTEDRLNSDLYDQLIYKFIRGHAEHMKNNLKINNYLVSKNKDVKILEDEEMSILGNFLSQHTSWLSIFIWLFKQWKGLISISSLNISLIIVHSWQDSKTLSNSIRKAPSPKTLSTIWSKKFMNYFTIWSDNN